MEKALIGMSGGVDSSVAAYLLKEEGYEVEGVSFVLYETGLRTSPADCCSLESIDYARRTAASIGVHHTVIELREEFLELVIEPFIDAYKKGFTPNPCILCNRHIKFHWLLKLADERNAAYIATGHYARVANLSDSPTLRFPGGFFLRKGVDARKDQSYVLYVLRKEELSRLKLPLGGRVKQAVRETAGRLHLPSAARPESQEICFIGDRNYCKFIEGVTEKEEGPIIDVENGKILGSHKGIHLYTVGQRKRIGITVGKPLFVERIDPVLNAIYVGPREAAMRRAFRVEGINWLVPIGSRQYEVSTKQPGACCLLPGAYSFRAGVKVRSTMKDEPATISVIDNDIAEVVFDAPQWAPAPGQSAVFYDGDTVLGGGIIYVML